eukprot:6190160-Pleurochrysis_carterae.AAC.1
MDGRACAVALSALLGALAAPGSLHVAGVACEAEAAGGVGTDAIARGALAAQWLEATAASGASLLASPLAAEWRGAAS